MDDYLDNYRLSFLARLVTENLIAKCRHCKTDEERFSLALKKVVQNSIVLFDSECKQKNAQHSIKLRENGNESFKSGQYYKALREYTESIVYAVDSSEVLALAYANRSATLFKLKKYPECIEDIDKSLEKNYPDELKTKLYKRKGMCLMTLDRPGADSAFKEALAWLDKMKLSDAEMNRSRSELSKLISSPCAVAKRSENVIQYVPSEIVTLNPEIPCASDAVSVKYSKKFGRHLVASRQIKPGEILILEKPYCLRLKPRSVYTHCSYCLKISWNLVPCKYCVNVAYCSESCKDKAWKNYHEVECPVMGQLHGFKFNNVLWISMRMAIMATQKGANLTALKDELANVDRNTDPLTKGYSDDGKFDSNRYRSVYSLANNADKCSAADHLVRAFWVAVTVCILAKESTMFGDKLHLDTLTKNPDVIFVGGLILKHVHIVYTNTHSFGASRDQSAGEHGHALFAVSSLLNHSCDANTIRQCYADCQAFYAAYPIEQGEQIFDNYGPRFVLMRKSERQGYFDRWHFKCECLPCAENWPLLRDISSYKRQALTQENKSKLDKVLQKFRVNNSAIQKGILENSPNILNDLLELIELLFKLAQRPCGELTMAVSMLKVYYEAADAIFDYEPISLSKIAKERTSYYSGFQQKLSR